MCAVWALQSKKGTFTKAFTQSSSDLSKKQTKETSVFCFVVNVGLFGGFFAKEAEWCVCLEECTLMFMTQSAKKVDKGERGGKRERERGTQS